MSLFSAVLNYFKLEFTLYLLGQMYCSIFYALEESIHFTYFNVNSLHSTIVTNGKKQIMLNLVLLNNSVSLLWQY